MPANQNLLDKEEIRKIQKRTEQTMLVLMILALPVFGMIYLYQTSGSLDWDLPELPTVLGQLLTGAGVGLLVAQDLLFRKRLKGVAPDQDLRLRIQVYGKATRERFLLLFIVSMVCSVGLLFYNNAVYTVIFAFTLFFFSVGKPTPERIKKLLKLNEEEFDIIKQTSKQSSYNF